MAKREIETWVKYLPEVGDPIMMYVESLNTIEREIAQLKARMTKERKVLRLKLAKLWTPEEIKAAERLAALEDRE